MEFEEKLHALRELLRTVDPLYYRLVLICGRKGGGKSRMIGAFAEEEGFPLVNVNLQLSRVLLEYPASRRALHVVRLFERVIEEAAGEGGVVLLDNLELLFDPSLQVDPMRLLMGASRVRTLVAVWPGGAPVRQAGRIRLRYAEEGHPEYRKYDLKESDLLLLEL